MWLLTIPAAPAASAQPLDTLLAQVDGRTVAASDIALARALGVLGFARSAGSIERGDIERFIDVLLMLEEAKRIGITTAEADIERAWAVTAARVGDEAALERWLEQHAVDRAWARRLVEADVVRSRFLEARFRAFVFVSEDDIARRLGPGPHDEAARERAREDLTRAAVEQSITEWLVAARKRAAVRMISDGSSIPLPFPPP